MPKVSIIIPVYNCEKYIERCVKSILNQDLKDIEVIAVNDGSPDNSLSILNSMAKNDPRLKIITQENKGAGTARNTGLKAANGEFIAFVDSDDFVDKKIYTTAVELAEKYNVDAVQYDYKILDEDEKLLQVMKQKREYSLRGVDLPINCVLDYKALKHTLATFDAAPWKRIYKKNFLIKNNIFFDTFKPSGEDIAFSFEVKLLGKIYYTDNILYNYTMRNGSISHNVNHNNLVKKILTDVKRRIEKHNMSETLKKEYRCCAIHFCNFEYDIKNKDTSDADFILSLNELKQENLIDEEILKEVEYTTILKRVKRELFWQFKDEIKSEIRKELKITPKKILKTIFSVQNERSNDEKHKTVTVLGLKMKFKKPQKTTQSRERE